MNKNYYEILEIDRNASKEIIDKAYKTLVKKYHPDLQSGQTQKENEEKMKEINEAYAVLSDDYRKTTYDEQLKNSDISQEKYQKILQENVRLKQELQKTTYVASDNKVVPNMGNAFNMYVQNLKNAEYQPRKKRKLKDYKNIIISIVIIVIVMLLIFQIPFVKRYFTQLYENNIIFRAIIDVFINTFKTGF